MFKNQKGFTVIEGLLLAIIVCAIGFVGWYVWSAQQKNKTPQQSSSQVPAESKPRTTNYVNKEFGYSYEASSELFYVEDANDPYNNDDWDKTTRGHSYRIPAGIKFSGGFITRDWQGKGNPEGFTVYPACQNASAKKILMIYETKDVCVAVQAFSTPIGENGFGGDLATLVVQKKFVKNDKIAGLEFSQQPDSVGDFSDKALKKAADSYGWEDAVVEFAKSIKEL